MITAILITIACAFCFIVGLSLGFLLGAVKDSGHKPTEPNEHFEPGGMYID